MDQLIGPKKYNNTSKRNRNFFPSSSREFVLLVDREIVVKLGSIRSADCISGLGNKCTSDRSRFEDRDYFEILCLLLFFFSFSIGQCFPPFGKSELFKLDVGIAAAAAAAAVVVLHAVM